MNLQNVSPRALVLAVLVSLLAFCAGHLWRGPDASLALLATLACGVGVLAAAALASQRGGID